ncbi:pentatricopeptide repeat-containing protein At5g27110 [Henckelia pumila]|uniref:pentatricopeptide repeat-containing protein At5g27110 n=1 Tax=Henckelia pumila TaxID=405737 RepID=UPI003C6DD354
MNTATIQILFSLLKSCTHTRSLKTIQTVHQKIISSGLQKNLALCKNLVNLYISCRAYKSANSVFLSLENPLDITLWNGLMAAYTKNFMYTEALTLYENLLQFPYLKPDSYTYPSVLKACGGLRRLDIGERIHADLTKSGLLSDVVISSSLVGVYAKCGLFGAAVKLFDEMPARDLACWNNVISCYYQSGQSEKALEYFERMRSFGYKPDSVSFTTAISSCARLLNLEKGESIHEELVRSGVALDAYVSAALVDMYGKCGCLEKAREVFNEIPNKSLVSWNTMIGGYSQIGDSFSCIKLLVRMNQEKLMPNSTTLSSLVMSCAKSAHLLHGKFIHGYILRKNVECDIFIRSSLIDMYFKCGCIKLAEKVFTTMPKTNIVSWNVMISGYVSAGCYFEALDIYKDMREARISPDAITFTSTLSACSQVSALERGKDLHKCIIESKFDSNVILMGAVLDMYAKCGAVEDAVGVFNQLSRRDLVSWTSMIVAYGSHGRSFEALKLFEDMLQSSIRPDRVTFLAVISACSHAGLVDEGRHFFNLMINDYGIQPTSAEYSCLIDLLGRAGRLQEAYELLQNTPTMKEDVELLSTLFAACHLHGDIVLGEKIASSLIEKDQEDLSTYVVLEKMYAATKNWNEAREIRLKMKEVGLRKSPGCSWIEVDRQIRSFLAEDNTSPGAESVFDCLSLMYSHMEKDENLNQAAL